MSYDEHSSGFRHPDHVIHVLANLSPDASSFRANPVPGLAASMIGGILNLDGSPCPFMQPAD
jgi:hypothetical protein